MQIDLEQLVEWQCGLVSRRQLNSLGVNRNRVRNQVAAGRWMTVGPMVVATFTGGLTWEQRCWVGHLHAGPTSVASGVSSARLQGLKGWDRPDVEVLVPANVHVPPIDGVRFGRSRRDLTLMRGQGVQGHLARLEPAVLLTASSGLPERAAAGLVAAVVQQRLTSPDRLLTWLERLQPLSRATLLRSVLLDIRGGAESMAEIDLGRVCRRFGLVEPCRQRRRRDRGGRLRWTDAEWDLPDARALVLEVDGGFHMEAGHWAADLKRQRQITTPQRTVVRATAFEVRVDPASLADDLRALGVPTRGRGAERARERPVTPTTRARG